MIENIEQKGLQPQKQEIKQEETLDQILQSKISDSITLGKAKPIFDEVQKSFSQSINDYIKELDDFKIDYIVNIEEDPVKYLIEDIDIKTGTKIIDVTKNEAINITNENVDITNENVDITNENVDITNENIDITNENVDITNENVDITNENVKEVKVKSEQEFINEQAKLTKESYDNLDKKYKVTDEQVQQAKTEGKISQNIINKITEKTQGTKLNPNDYLKFYLAAETNKDELKDTEFMKNYEKLNEKLGIVPEKTTLQKTIDPKNTDKLIDANKSLKNYTDNSNKFDKITAPALPETKDFDTEFTTYVKFITDEKIRKNIENNKDIIKNFKEILDKDPDSAKGMKGNKEYDIYIEAINDIKNNLPKKTQEMIKQRVLGSCITGLASYFDNSNIEENNFADNFDIDTQEGFTIKDDILAIKGGIKGNNVGFYYDLTNPDAQLQSDDFLHFDGISETFAFGIDRGGKNNLGVKLPTISMLSTQAQEVSERDFSVLLETSANLEDFEIAMKKQVSKELLKNYGQEAFVKTRVERDVEKNITAQTLNTIFVPEAVLTTMNENKSIDKTTEKRARKLLKIRDKTTENMRSDEIIRFRGLIEKLDPLIAKDNHKNLEPKWENLLNDIDNERGAVSYNDQRGTKTLKFFKKFSKDDKMNLQDLEVFINNLEKEESITDNISKYSPDFQTGEDKDDANKLLDNLA